MNTLSTIDGHIVDNDEQIKPPKPMKSRLLSRALSAGRARVPPSYKDAERSLSPPPRKFDDKRRKSDGAVASKEIQWDAREEIEPSTKPMNEHPDDASRDEASVNSGPDTKIEVKGRSKYAERAASAGRARSTGRFRVESRPRYRDQHKRQAREHRDDFERQDDTTELETPKLSYSIQTGIQTNVSGLTAMSPRAQGATSYQVRDVPPPPPQVHSMPVTPEQRHAVSGFHTPKSQFAKSYGHGQMEQVQAPIATNTSPKPTINPTTLSNYNTLQQQSRKDQARQRIMERMKDIDSRVKGRRGGTKPWEMENRHVLDGVSDQDQGKLIVPPLMDEDGVWRDPVNSSPTNLAASGGYDDGAVKSLQSRIEYYKTCLKSNEKKLDELIESEKELHDMLKSQQEEYEKQQKVDSEQHEKEMNEVNEAMGEAKNAIDALESTIEKLNEASEEKDECISELKEKLGLVELELKEQVAANEERVTDYDDQIAILKKNVSELKTTLVEKDDQILAAEKKCKELEEQVAKLSDQYNETEAAYKSTCSTVQEKEQLLAQTVKDMEQEKSDLVFNFEQYRGDLEYKVEATSVRMEAITKEKDKLIGSLNRKIELLESSLIEKEDEVKQHSDWKMKQVELEAGWMLKEKELNNNIQTLAMSLTEKDKELDNVHRLLEHERKLKAASDERIGAVKNELSKCQQELIDERRKQNEAELNSQRMDAALSPRSTARRKHHKSSRRREDPKQEDPPASPRVRYVERKSRQERSPRNYHSRRQRERYQAHLSDVSSSDYESADSIFDFSS